MKIHIVVLALLALPSAAWCADWKALSGTYAITPEHYLDPSTQEPNNSHLRFQLDGAAARDLYEALPGGAVTDDCTGLPMKRSGQIRCRVDRNDSSYACDFSIDLWNQEIGSGVAC